MLAVKYLDGQLLSDIGARFDLPNLRTLGSEPVKDNENVYVVSDSAGAAIARFAWMPNRPGGKIVSTVLPFMAIAFGGFALLTGLALRYIRRTAVKLAEGENRLRHLALHDPLSGLPNRTFFGERLAAVIADTGNDGTVAAVLAIDLDHFKDINDTLGHHIGDGLIGVVAQRLVHAVRREDLVARLGGDEFAVITTDAPDLEALERFAERLIAILRAPYSISGHTLLIGASIGIAVIEGSAADAADIMRRADVALYRAKNEGRSRACIYDADMDADLRERKQLENDLRAAIAEDGLSVAYQPIMNASGEKMAGVEALCRWHHPARGDVPPVDFIPIAERSELIIPLGEWVLRKACLEAQPWNELTVAVNVSPLQFRRQDFVEVVERILAETEFDPQRLELELTESTLLGNVDDAEKAMHRLKARGVRFALDDFGTGYSSLLYLRRFPFDRIKIDRSFVRSIETAADAASIVHAIVSLGRGLGMKVTAEGVETAEQQLFLRAAGVHSMQGYRFGKPRRPMTSPSVWSRQPLRRCRPRRADAAVRRRSLLHHSDRVRLRVYGHRRTVRNGAGDIQVEACKHRHVAECGTLRQDRVHRIEDECQRHHAARRHFVQHPGGRDAAFRRIEHQNLSHIRLARELVRRPGKYPDDTVEIVARRKTIRSDQSRALHGAAHGLAGAKHRHVCLSSPLAAASTQLPWTRASADSRNRPEY